MPARIIQWKPVDAFDELYLIPRDNAGELFATRARELGLELVAKPARIYAPGVNIDGGWVEVGEPLLVARIADATIHALARATAELAALVEPTRFLVRDPDGVRAVHAPHLLEDVGVFELSDWQQHLVREGEQPLLVAAVTEAMVARGATEADLADLERLVALAPTELDPHVLLAKLYLQLGRLDDAEREAAAAIALDAKDYRKAPAHLVLGEVATARGTHALAFTHCEAAVKAHRTTPALLALGVAAMRVEKLDTAWRTLAPPNRARTLFEIAEAMCAIGRIPDAHAYLELALEIDRGILKPVPENQWPKPPDTAWTASHAELAALVDIVLAGTLDG